MRFIRARKTDKNSIDQLPHIMKCSIDSPLKNIDAASSGVIVGLFPSKTFVGRIKNSLYYLSIGVSIKQGKK
jgi:hypothetical protein